EKVRDELDKLCKKNTAVREEFIAKGMCAYAKDEDGDELLDRNGVRIKEPFTDDFAKKLLGQIVFLYFLQKKGWFGVERDNQWGTGDKHFLRTLLSSNADKTNFFDNVLEPLFYNALAVKREHDWSDRFNCKIPFLNGGLFEPLNNYDWVHIELNLPNSLFSNTATSTQGDKGTGILDVFDRYNFTINEAEPLEVEVAVDPEMLGKIFENLLPENIRHGSGTYYTPRVIVAYMCQQSLINYLASQMQEIPREDLETFIRFGSQQRDYTEAGTQSQAEKFLPKSVVENAPGIDDKIAQITVCDPAVGSGAFPVGMMLEIVKAREALQSVEGTQRVSQYHLKRQTIENCLYGVDIDSGAVEIAKLRLWLSLIVDEADFKRIEPLPNLDYKIMQGNSLLDEFRGVKLIDDSLLTFKELDKEAKIKEIDAAIAQLTRDLGSANVGKQSKLYQLTKNGIAELIKQRKMVIDGQVDFLQSELFAPADESHQKLQNLKSKHKEIFNETRKDVKERLRAEAEEFEWRFIEAKLHADGHADELAELQNKRNDLRKDYFLWQLNFPEIFEKGGFDVIVGNPPYGLVFDDVKKEAYERRLPTFKRNNDIYVAFYEFGINLLNRLGTISFITPNTFLNGDYFGNLRRFMTTSIMIDEIIDYKHHSVFDIPTVYVGVLVGNRGSISRPSYRSTMLIARDSITDLVSSSFVIEIDSDARFKPANPVMDRIYKDGSVRKLEELFFVKDVGFNYWTIGKGKKRDGNSIGDRVFYSGGQKNRDDKSFLKGRDILKWTYSEPTNWLRHNYKTYLNSNDKFGFSANFLEQTPKVIYRQTANTIIATADYEGHYSDKTVHLIVSRDGWSEFSAEALLALMNSRLFAYLYSYISQETEGRAFAQVKTTYIKQLPIPHLSSRHAKAIENVVGPFQLRSPRRADHLLYGRQSRGLS
ncbi:MAG: TaqI-like C-terminal specificity domain-containing protein, partial [bacterium]|nr:TaqI-like C-terminal specificity domain-containing protein [bacterium]